MDNRKVIGAKELRRKGIAFKSNLELYVYTKLTEAGIYAEYEPVKITIIESFVPKKPFYTAWSTTKKTRISLKLDDRQTKISYYTPDFIASYNGNLFVIEAKGYPTDGYISRRKLIRKAIESSDYAAFFEVSRELHVSEMIDIIKSYGSSQ